jgi:DNA polymerase III epsilon subunit-like protein
MTPWHDGRLVAFDVETSGIDLEEARIVTAAIAVCGGGQETQTLTLLADPNSARWEAHPGTEFVLDDLRSWQINTERITLIEEGFAEPEPGE